MFKLVYKWRDRIENLLLFFEVGLNMFYDFLTENTRVSSLCVEMRTTKGFVKNWNIKWVIEYISLKENV